MEWMGMGMGHMFGVFCDGWNGGQKGMGYSCLLMALRDQKRGPVMGFELLNLFNSHLSW
jgi:hypothetical protein